MKRETCERYSVAIAVAARRKLKIKAGLTREIKRRSLRVRQTISCRLFLFVDGEIVQSAREFRIELFIDDFDGCRIRNLGGVKIPV